jgi:SAM-dependent methyltransferase
MRGGTLTRVRHNGAACDCLRVMTQATDPRTSIQASLQRASNYNTWIVDQAKRHLGRRVLDAGCGAGNLTRLLLDRDLVVAVDEWPDFVNIMGESFAGVDNVAVHAADLADPGMPAALEQYGIDSVICSNVLEHVEDDGAALTNMATLLPPGAPIFLLVPAFMALYGEHDRADHHFRRYTKRSLRKTVAPLPLEIETDYYMNLPGFFAWFLYVRALRRELNEGGIGLYDRVIPAIRAVEERVRPPFGQTLVAVLRTTGR